MVRFIFAKTYEAQLSQVEDFIFSSRQELGDVEKFLDEHDELLDFLSQNPKTPAVHPVTGDQSWIFGTGRYRAFFRVIFSDSEVIIHMISLIDNRQMNGQIYPSHLMPTYEED
jgi:hypothetical protein